MRTSRLSPFAGRVSFDGRARKISAQAMETRARLFKDSDLPLCYRANVPGMDAAAWFSIHRAKLEGEILHHGGLLLRGFQVANAAQFHALAQALSPALIEYRERSSPRSRIREGVYTSTDHPPDQPIVLHNEQSYTLSWPGRILFCAQKVATSGGRTPLADNRRITRRLPRTLVEPFHQKQILYMRNYNGRFGLSWQMAFQTEDRGKVADYCRAMDIQHEWLSGDRLRTWQVRPAFRRHPGSGEVLWFNHALFFNISSLAPELRDRLLGEMETDALPFNTFYGDGTAIAPAVIESLKASYQAETVSFNWQPGDVLILDNMLSSHGREPFSGERQVMTIMTDPMVPSGSPIQLEEIP